MSNRRYVLVDADNTLVNTSVLVMHGGEHRYSSAVIGHFEGAEGVGIVTHRAPDGYLGFYSTAVQCCLTSDRATMPSLGELVSLRLDRIESYVQTFCRSSGVGGRVEGREIFQSLKPHYLGTSTEYDVAGIGAGASIIKRADDAVDSCLTKAMLDESRDSADSLSIPLPATTEFLLKQEEKNTQLLMMIRRIIDLESQRARELNADDDVVTIEFIDDRKPNLEAFKRFLMQDSAKSADDLTKLSLPQNMRVTLLSCDAPNGTNIKVFYHYYGYHNTLRDQQPLHEVEDAPQASQQPQVLLDRQNSPAIKRALDALYTKKKQLDLGAAAQLALTSLLASVEGLLVQYYKQEISLVVFKANIQEQLRDKNENVVELSKHRGYKNLLANLFLAMTGIGLIVMTVYASRGHGFFLPLTNTDSKNKVEDLRCAVNEYGV